MEKYVVVFFFKKVVKSIILCHLFYALFPTDFVSDKKDVKKKTVLKSLEC